MKLLNLFSQDGIQRTKGQWSFSIPDNLGRIVLTGTCISANSTAISIGRFDNSIIKAELFTTTGTYKGYNVKLNSGDLTLDNAVVLSVNYYDGYDFLGTNDIPNNDATQFKPEAGYGLQLTSSKSLLTGTVTAKMNADGSTPTYLYSVMYYDNLGRLIQTKSNNQLEEGTEEEHIAYTFTGKIKNRKRVHSAMGKATHAEVYSYSYDHAERLLSVSHQLNEGNALTLAQYTYDEVGRIKTKTLASETSNYSYNVRSWLTQIAGSKFNQTLVYNQSINGITPTKALYNGNISAMKWKAGNETTERGYKFTYDNLSRLTDANYGEGASIASNLNRFNEKLSYDKMGNIMTLQRGGKITSSTYNLIDNLTYTYTGNHLTKVTDAVTTPITNESTLHFVDGANVDNEYVYDANGNLIKDLNKNITLITYNYLNLPNVITFADGNSITYDYDANGSKLSVAYKIGGNIANTEYVGNKVYKNGTLSMILTEEGYITMNGTTPTYHYFLKDHQGNNRVVMNHNGTVEQVNHYYPFGGLFGEGMQDSNQPYKYNGKEFDNLLGLNMYDYGARHYDPYTGGWVNVDPHAERYTSWSPYSFVFNNPLVFIDPDGRDPIYAKNFWGRTKLIGDDGKEDGQSYLVSGAVKRDVRGAIKAGENYTGSLTENDNVFKIPTGGVMDDVINSVNDTRTSEKEHGGHANFGDANATRWNEGIPAQEVKDASGNVIGAKASMNAFMVNGQSQMPSDASNVEYWCKKQNSSFL